VVARAGILITVAVPFGWLGMVLAISCLEAPLKFRAPGVTLPLGLGVGRLVFRALNVAETALVVLLAVAGVAVGMLGAGWGLLAVLAAVLAVQVLLLRPRLDRRAGQIMAGQVPPPARLHLAYSALEGAKALALPGLGVALTSSVLP
jgi:hypothetical protein